jgi:hypothetical protein
MKSLWIGQIGKIGSNLDTNGSFRIHGMISTNVKSLAWGFINGAWEQIRTEQVVP